MKKEYMIDAITLIDREYITEYVQYETKLGIMKSRRQKRTRSLLITAACLALVVCMLVVSLPLSFILLGSEPGQEWSNQVIEYVLFPLDKQPETPNDPDAPSEPMQEKMILNWIEWEITERIFSALSAGTEHSTIETLKNAEGGVFSSAMSRFGKFLERLYDYYLRHKKEIDEIIGLPESSDDTTDLEQTTYPDEETTAPDQDVTEEITEEDTEAVTGDITESITEDITTEPDEETTPPEPRVYTDEQNVMYRTNDDVTYWIVLGRTEQAKQETEQEGRDFTLTIPEQIDGLPVKEIAAYAFYEENRLTDIVLPEGLERIGEWAFSNANLTNLILPESLVLMQEHAFSHIYELKSVTFLGEISELPFAAFYYCVKLQEVYLHDGIKKIGIGAFGSCFRLKTINYPETIEVIEERAFDSCYSLGNILIPDASTSIGNNTFMGVGSYAWSDAPEGEQFDPITLEIPKGVSQIGTLAFAGCALEKVVIPNSVTVIGDAAFSDCHLLNEIEYHGTVEEWNAIEQNSGAYCFGLNWAGDWEASTIRVICTDGELTIDQIPFVHNY